MLSPFYPKKLLRDFSESQFPLGGSTRKDVVTINHFIDEEGHSVVMDAPVYGEVSEKIFRICLPIPHLKAPTRLIPGVKGISGQFRVDKAAAAASGDYKAAFTVILKNGMIDGELSPLSLKVHCSLREPVVNQTFTVPALVAEVIPAKCKYEIQDGFVTLRLCKADRFHPWTLELAEKGLNFNISDNLTTDTPKDVS